MTNAADYQRAYRARVKKGRAVLRIEVEVGATGDMLQANGFLEGDWNLENPREVARGLERLIEEMNSGHAHGIEFYLE